MEHVELNTGELQLRSLYNFMGNLGYLPAHTSAGKIVFQVDNPVRKTPNNLISFNTAVKMHNALREDYVEVGADGVAFSNVRLNIAFTQLAIYCATASRFVHKVKLHRTKHGVITVLSNKVKPTGIGAPLFEQAAE